MRPSTPENQSLKPFAIGQGTNGASVSCWFTSQRVLDSVHAANYLHYQIRMAHIPQFDIVY